MDLNEICHLKSTLLSAATFTEENIGRYIQTALLLHFLLWVASSAEIKNTKTAFSVFFLHPRFHVFVEKQRKGEKGRERERERDSALIIFRIK